MLNYTLIDESSRLSRTYGKGSTQVQAFGAITAEEFDGNASYRIMYKLRNYVQHCGLPIDTAAVNSRLADQPGTETLHDIVVGAKTEGLLNTYDGWGKARADLAEIGDTVRPQDLAPKVMESLERIERRVLQAEVFDLHRAGVRLTDLLREGQRENGVPVLATLTPFDGGANIQLHEPPYPVLKLLRLVRFQSDGHPVIEPRTQAKRQFDSHIMQQAQENSK